MFWLAEDHCVVAQSSASRNVENRLDLHVRLRGLQPGAHAEPDAQRSSDVVSPGRSVSERRSNASFGRLVARKITPQTLKNSRMTQTNLEFAGSARFFSSLLGFVARCRTLRFSGCGFRFFLIRLLFIEIPRPFLGSSA